MRNSNNMEIADKKVTIFHKALVETEDDDGDEWSLTLSEPAFHPQVQNLKVTPKMCLFPPGYSYHLSWVDADLSEETSIFTVLTDTACKQRPSVFTAIFYFRYEEHERDSEQKEAVGEASFACPPPARKPH